VKKPEWLRITWVRAESIEPADPWGIAWAPRNGS
jgi:hypothetical protein